MSAAVPRSTVTQVVAVETKVDEKKDDVIDEVSAVPDEQLLEEVIPDDLSEFSDEADEILNRQEVRQKKKAVHFLHINSSPTCPCFASPFRFL